MLFRSAIASIAEAAIGDAILSVVFIGTCLAPMLYPIAGTRVDYAQITPWLSALFHGNGLNWTAQRSPTDRATVATGVATGTALGVMAYALGPLGFPLRFTGAGPASLYDAAMVLGIYLAVAAPLAAGLAAGRRDSRPGPAGSGIRQGTMAGLMIGASAALVVAILSTATIAMLPYDTWLRQWA